MKNNLLKKFLSFSIGGYLNAILGLIMIPVITRIIPPKEFGIASLISVIQNILFLICSLGLQHAFLRFFHEEESKGRLLYNVLFYPFFISILLFFLSFIFKEKIAEILIGKKENYLWFILTFGSFLMTLKIFSYLIIKMKQKAKLYSFLTTFEKVLEFIFILILLKKYGNSYKTLSIAFIFSLIVTNLIAIYIEKEDWKLKGKETISRKELLNYSLPLSVTMALNWVFASCDKILIKILSTPIELGLYSGAFKIIGILSVIQSGFTSFWMSIAYEHYSKNKNDNIFFKNMLNIFSLLFFGLGIGLLFTRDLILLFLGEKYREAIFIFPMLIFNPIMYCISEITTLGISFSKKTKYYFYISLVVAIINLIGNIVLIPHFGAKGAAISTGIVFILFFILRTYFSTKLINFGFDLKRIYSVIFLMFIYAMVLTFYNNIYFTILVGILLEVIVLLIYLPVLKEIYFKYLKKEKIKE
ncbi:MAG: oligosaccharide flippase family protein [Fusobacterium perfoetens]|uniref:oligosaccharide flippase family protein n=1 Tax=Fusobacterium perfoetens TaxID=852 RepID=UPI0023F032A4|nr:oligosaccharide flippase family protein [Fusobacterium perfoetens]MCI6152847.1 oligosaccharide flippase family protein [Fusobacterium perfoetens]MDY3237257.1 oligosaccharide flippase family protein [Fusobacterium perfoetens]